MGRVKVAPGKPAFDPPSGVQRTRVRAGSPAYVNAFSQGGAIVGVLPGGKMVRLQGGGTSLFLEASTMTAEVARELRSSRAVIGLRTEGRWARVECVDYDFRERVVAWLDSLKVPTFEGDVGSVQRWQLDARPRLAPPRACYLDFESDSRVPMSKKETARLLCWSLRDVATGELVACRVLKEDTDEAEREMLVAMWAALESFDQVIAWNGDRFDFVMMVARSARHAIQVQPRRLLYLDHMKLFQKSNVMAAESGAEKQFISLQSIATEVAGASKLDFDSSKTWEAWENDRRCSGAPDCMACRRCLLKYCNHDTEVEHLIEHETGYIALFQSICELCGVFPDSRAVNPQVQVESLLFDLARERDYKPRTRPKEADRPKGDQFRGAYVMEPKGKGLQQFVHVADFAAMYPSIIVSWNMSSEMRRDPLPDPTAFATGYYSHLKKPWTPQQAVPPGCSLAPGAYFDQAEQGMLPTAITRLLDMRRQYRDLENRLPPKSPEWLDAHRKNTAAKIAVNQIFGVASSSGSRFYDRAVGEAITQAGVLLIERTIEAAEKRFGMRVIYCDTDSIFVVGCTRDELERFIEWCNAELYPGVLAEHRCTRNTVKLEGDKGFKRIVWTAAKKYCGKLWYAKGEEAPEGTPPEIKGLEYKRGDVVKLARDMQWEAIQLVLADDATPEACVALVERWKQRCLEGALELGDVVTSKRLTKALREYARKTKKDGSEAAPPPHVAIARLLQKRGRDIGEGVKVEYFTADGASSPKKYLPGEDWKGECDRHELWEGAVYPATMRLLAAAFPVGPWKDHAKTRPRKARKGADVAGATLPLSARRKPAEGAEPAAPGPQRGFAW